MRLVLVCLMFGMAVCQLSHAQQKADEFTRPIDHFAYAQGLKRGAIWDFAQRAFEEFIAKNPGHELEASAWSELIDCLRRQEKHQQMLDRIASFRKKWPKHQNLDLFMHWAGISYYQRKMYKEAGKQFEVLLDSKKDFLRECGTYLLADCLLRGPIAGHQRAYDLLAKVGGLPLRKDRPYRETAAFLLGRHYQHDLQFDQALTWFGKLCAYAGGNSALREEAMYLVGEIHYSRNDYAGACQGYDNYLAIFSNGKWSSEVRKRRAQATYMQKRFDAALKQVLEWRKRHPGVSDYEMDTLHGRCLLQMGEFATAQAHFQVVVTNEQAPLGTRRYCLVQSIYCLLQDTATASWERGLEQCRLYFKHYRDINYEPAVLRYQGLLEEKLGRYAEAVSSFGKALQNLGEKDKAQRRGLMLHQVQCLVKLEQWTHGAVLLRKLSAEPGVSVSDSIGYLLSAGDLELKVSKTSQQAEKDFLVALKRKGLSDDQRRLSHQRLLGIYLERKQSSAAHSQLDKLIPLTEGDSQELYQYKDALILIELGEEEQAANRLREALRKTRFADEGREVGMRLALLGILQMRVGAGDNDAAGEMIEHYRCLAAKPVALTDSMLTPGILYQMALLVSARYSSNPSVSDRNLLEATYRRAIGKGFKEAAAFYAAYRLGRLYMEQGDGRYGLAEKVLRPMTDTLMTLVNSPQKHEELLRQLDQGENLLRDSLSLLAECYYELKRDLEALSVADQVLRRGLSYPAAKRCLLVQARIYYYREPRQLEKALEKLARYQYTLTQGQMDSGDEEEVMVLLVNVQRELKRHAGAQRAYRQLKVRYPKRAAREPWAKEYEANRGLK